MAFGTSTGSLTANRGEDGCYRNISVESIDDNLREGYRRKRENGFTFLCEDTRCAD